jgi:hypothetical protein
MRLLLILALLYVPLLRAQKAENFGILKLANEEVIFGFALKKSNKIVLLCKDKNDSYLVYRFGTRDKVELSYPTAPDKTSWKKFEYSGYSRGGGKQNAAMLDQSLSFTNNGVRYELYENWNSEEDFIVRIGINVTANKKTTDLKGDANHRWGSLEELRFLDEYLPNKWGE